MDAGSCGINSRAEGLYELGPGATHGTGSSLFIVIGLMSDDTGVSPTTPEAWIAGSCSTGGSTSLGVGGGPAVGAGTGTGHVGTSGVGVGSGSGPGSAHGMSSAGPVPLGSAGALSQ